MILRRAQPSESRAVAAWVKERHYLASTPPGYVFAFEFVEGSQVVGAMLLGRPSSRGYDAANVLELTRVYFVDEMGKNTESRALAMARKYVRTWAPQVRLLLSYSDPSQGHVGTIYDADGWAPLGMTTHKNGYGWKSRGGRRDDPVTPKQRWVRTP